MGDNPPPYSPRERPSATQQGIQHLDETLERLECSLRNIRNHLDSQLSEEEDAEPTQQENRHDDIPNQPPAESAIVMVETRLRAPRRRSVTACPILVNGRLMHYNGRGRKIEDDEWKGGVQVARLPRIDLGRQELEDVLLRAAARRDWARSVADRDVVPIKLEQIHVVWEGYRTSYWSVFTDKTDEGVKALLGKMKERGWRDIVCMSFLLDS